MTKQISISESLGAVHVKNADTTTTVSIYNVAGKFESYKHNAFTDWEEDRVESWMSDSLESAIETAKQKV